VSELLLSTAFTLWGFDTSWLELTAVLLSLGMVACTIAEKHWGWPLAALSSGLYFFLFWRQRLYGDACLQIMFIGLALWGWSLWLKGQQGTALPISHMSSRQRWQLLCLSGMLWLLTGLTLLNFTDSDVPWWDAFPTAISLVGQYLLAQKRVENWAVWMIVNSVASGLFAWKGLWLTALLYLVFVALSVTGWRHWTMRMHEAHP
jgi:nicotinamide mononucleotide transporter